jgi:hypothetical protein
VDIRAAPTNNINLDVDKEDLGIVKRVIDLAIKLADPSMIKKEHDIRITVSSQKNARTQNIEGYTIQALYPLGLTIDNNDLNIIKCLSVHRIRAPKFGFDLIENKLFLNIEIISTKEDIVMLEETVLVSKANRTTHIPIDSEWTLGNTLKRQRTQ